MYKDIFFNRNYYLERLSKHFKDFVDGYRRNLALIGNELIGKTSLVLHFLNKFVDNRILTIYVSIKKEDFKNFAERFMKAMLYNFLHNCGIELKEDFDYLINKSERFIPQTVKKIKEIRTALKNKKNSIFLELLSLCDILNKETKKLCVIIFDEFHNLELMGIRDLYKDWAKVLVLQKNTMFVVISSYRFKAKKILGSSLNVLFGKFELIDMEPFDYKTSREFLIYGLNGLILESKLIDFLVSISGGIPFYLKVISESIYKIKDRFSSDTYANKNTVLDTLVDLLFEEDGIINQRFCNFLNKIYGEHIKHDTLKILCCISSGYNRINDIVQNTHMPKKLILKSMHQLLEMDIITKNGDFFKINDRLLNLWLRFVYHRKDFGLDFNFRAQRQTFKEELEKIYNQFISDSNKGLLERIIEIMHLFENAHVDIDNKRLTLTNFREIKPVFFESMHIKEGLIARSAEHLWIVGIKQNFLREEDIEEFSQFCNKHKQKKQKRIIITSCEIDPNVRLKALEEKILTWEIKNINLLCELFNRPLILG